MRSYWDHLEETTKKESLNKKEPAFRASAIFPVMQSPLIQSRVLFFGYWMVKRNIPAIGFVKTLRRKDGTLLSRTFSLITEPRAFRVEVKDILEESEYGEELFEGSLELEFFSSMPLVFPFPATTVNYYGADFSTFVHTAERIFNNYEDYQANTVTKVAESGFNITLANGGNPFFAFVNGPKEDKDKNIKATFINANGNIQENLFRLGKVAPYETKFIYPAKEIDLAPFLKNEIGTLKLNFDIEWAFPRLLVGNFQDIPFIASITHSYYDCTTATSKKDYWLDSEEKWHDASLILPLLIEDDLETTLSFYPIYTPSQFSIDAEIYTLNGTLIGKGKLFENLESESQFKRFPMKNFVRNFLGKDPIEPLSIRLIATKTGKDPIPSRIKIALDVTQKKEILGCNICTNLQPFNPDFEKKNKSFRWAPLVFDTPHFCLFIMNSSPEKDYKKSDKILLQFYRESDLEILRKEIEIPPHGAFLIDTTKSEDLEAFFQGKTGWVTVESGNPYLVTYYLALHPSGAVGGDHGY
ncbi:hypothetical protein [Criblamydia sequanensis]|uniref:Uncharacterized protein n=1 Tax=Candidatus Criblamydia sequanensis CRIB-18 TaxID=1437425 RepID=A0A090D092_9BACT|nr:hypothetical protein [Criblamydia sequanensis]CDR32978.1 conserved hypothetical protein [Criblamydia sequanensis CRIB-18]